MIIIEQETLTNEVVDQLIELSIEWEMENSCFGYRRNTKEDLSEPLVVAKEGDRIIGYCFGHFYVTDKPVSEIKVGENCFFIDEIFVKAEYRNKGIGSELFKAMENIVKDNVSYITLSTATKDYKKALNFYTGNADMTCHSSFLFKQIDKN